MSKIYAVDFDGTLCRSKYPQIGSPIMENIKYVKKLKEDGNKIILWTCRSGDLLQEAIDWCGEQGIELDGANENLEETLEAYEDDSRKIFAHYYIDDKNLYIEEERGEEDREMNRDKERQIRAVASDLKVNEESEEMYLEGYFAVFNRQTELWPGAYEEIDLQAFDGTLANDVRCLINHDTTLVLGRNKANTLELKTDSHGLWGRVKINKNDSDAVNTYERVKRGDVSGNSFGFNILREETDYREDGTVKWIIKEIDLHEVSICTFPAYEDTNIQARKKEVEQHKERQLEVRKKLLKERLDKCLNN